MAMRKHPSRFRAIRPATENLEGRQLLSGMVSGVNTEGDAWVLKLVGPGSIRVLKQPDANGNPTSLTTKSEIATITVAGTNPLSSRLIGTVTPSSTGTGHVFFQNFTEVVNRRENGTGGNGLLSIDMPQFYLGLTAAQAPTTPSTTSPLPGISIPDGVTTLDFGGVDTTAFFGTNPALSLANSAQSNQILVALGLPQYGGTRVIVNKVVSTGAAATGATGTPTQQGVTFEVAGRLELFQANEIDGNSQFAPAFFSQQGGTTVESLPDPTTGIIGPIGMVKVGTNATNFNVLTNDKINTFFIGGETSNVGLLAGNGSRNLYFGKGMDTVEVFTHTIQKLFANRGAVNSKVIVDRQIDNSEFGGDVIGTTVEAGFNQNISSIFSQFAQTGSFPTTFPTPTAQAGGQIRTTVAGDITNSIFVTSRIPDPTTSHFGTPNDLQLPLATIKGRVEGTINNATITPDSPQAAFYAQQVILTNGAVVPPTVPEAPYTGRLQPATLPGIPNPYAYAGIGVKTPKGPRG